MKNLTKKIPLAVYFYIIFLISHAHSLIAVLSRTAQSNAEGISLMPSIINIIFDIVFIVFLIRNKKDLPLFIVSAISSAQKLFGVLSGFSIWGVLDCAGSLLITFIIATTVFPELAEYQPKVRKLYFLPSLLIFVSDIFQNIGIFSYITLISPLSLFGNLILPAATSFFLASWCIKSAEDSSAGNKKEKTIFRIIAVILIICIALTVYMEYGYTSTESSDTCQSCGREFTDSKNKKSIARTHMCDNCFNNYKSLEWVLDE
ncbi:MAG: hypothetical protein IJO03_03935 [Clostridia bacterium]|nr:hypothetical protein [Clostridia bacterium]